MKHFFIILFCLWHASAVALYSIPTDAKDAFSVAVRMHVIPVIRPYLFLTSQWQQWNLFSPDPLRRVTLYELQIETNGMWDSILQIDPYTLAWFRDANELKLLRRLEEGGNGWSPLMGRYIEDMCRSLNIPGGTLARIGFRSTILPAFRLPQRVATWRTWEPDWGYHASAPTACP